MTRLAVFVSGSGSDMQSVMDAIKCGALQAEIVLVVSSRAGVYALERAAAFGAESVVFDKHDYISLAAMYDKLIALLKEKAVDYILLAGYLTILTPNIVEAYRRRIINIHPSLIPKYCGKGYYGMTVHRAVIEGGETISGATVHYVDEGADTGEIIAQGTVAVLPGDTAESLQRRVLELEHKLLPETLIKLFN